MDNQQIAMIYNYILPIILFMAGQTVAFTVAGIKIYTSVMTRLKVLEVEMRVMKDNETELYRMMNSLLESTHRIEVILQNKKDKE